MNTSNEKITARMPRYMQEERLADYFRKLEKDPLYTDQALFEELDSDLLESVEYELERILDEILDEIQELEEEVADLKAKNDK